jgi:LacI family transcriptional regulator
VALIGFNDIEFCSMKGIELTTIGQKKFEMGAIAVAMLVERIEKNERKPFAKEIFLKPELIIRKTCGFHLGGYQIESANPSPLILSPRGENQGEGRIFN